GDASPSAGCASQSPGGFRTPCAIARQSRMNACNPPLLLREYRDRHRRAYPVKANESRKSSKRTPTLDKPYGPKPEACNSRKLVCRQG
ncbi:MAG: hypothetical protein N3B01_11600, partial [Verrucomicrobiae bacterium]|nr:hypothetical protein [Verrucomicrobiae bacterium]